MSVEHRAYDNEHGDPVVVLVVTGTHDVSRLLNLMAGASPNTEQRKVAFAVRAQVRRHNGGRAAMRLLREHGGPDFTCDACGCNPAGPGPDNSWPDGEPHYDIDCPVHGDPRPAYDRPYGARR